MHRSSIAIFGLLLALLLPGVLLADGAEASADEQKKLELEKKLIEKAARDYIDGWYEGNPERMARALHPDLAKQRRVTLPNDREMLQKVTREAMVEYTRLGAGPKSRREGQVNEVIILDVSSYTASVKTVSYQLIDYLHLAKVNGEWRIVNILWEPKEADSE